MERNENGYQQFNVTPESAPRDCGRDMANGKMNLQNGCRAEGGNGGASGSVGNNGNCSSPEGMGMMNGGANARLAMAHVPMQCWRMLYSPDYGLARGTIFEELDLPLEVCANE